MSSSKRSLFYFSSNVLLYIVVIFTFIFITQHSSLLYKVFIKKVQRSFNTHVMGLSEKNKFQGNRRCKVRRIGCFKTIKEKALFNRQKNLSRGNHSLQECQWQCYKRKFHYVAYAATGRCFCGRFVTKLHVLNNGLLLKDNSSECLSKRHMDVYMIEKCAVKIKHDVYLQAIGCHSKVLLKRQGWITASLNISLTSCFLTCEDRGFLLASHSHMKECYCFNPTPNIGYPTRATTVEFSWCDRGSEDHMLVMRTYVEDQRCSSKQFLANRTPLTGLVSYPGSGNSWTRHLIELASGYYTGSFYNSPIMYRKGQLGEALDWRSGRTIVIKSHKPKVEHAIAYDRVILLVRNPYDALLAEFNRRRGGKTGFASPQNFRSQGWKNYVSQEAFAWSRTVDAYITTSVPLLVVYFEDLVTDTISVVKTMLKFIGVKVDNLEQRLVCLQGDISGNFHRENVKLNPYSTSMIEIINERIKKVRKILKARGDGYKVLPNYERDVPSS